MIKSNSSIQTKFFRKMIYITVIAASLWCLIWIGTEFLLFNSESDDLCREYIQSQKVMLKSQVTALTDNITVIIKQIEKEYASKLDDMTAQAKRDILERIIHRRFGEEGYFFGSTFKGEPLFSNGKITAGSNSIWNLTDPDGVKIIQEQIKVARQNPKGGFVNYSWHKLNSKAVSPKIAFVKALPEWEWVVGAGIYLDTVEEMILHKKTALYDRLKTKVILSMVVLILLLCLIYFWARRIGNQMQQSIDAFINSLKHSDGDSIHITPETIQLKEFKEIARITNQCFQERVNAQKQLLQNKKELQRQNHNFKIVFENAPYALLLVDENIRVEMINHQGVSFTGKKEEDIIGCFVGEVFNCLNFFEGKGCDYNPNCSHCDIRTRIVATFKTGKPCLAQEGQMTLLAHGHKKVVYLHISTTLLKLDAGVRVLLTLTDITEQKYAEQKRKKLEAQLHQAQKMESIGTLAGGIAHDFNNILFPVMGYTEMLLEDISDDDPLKKSITQIYNGTLRAKELVKQILTFARQEDGELRLMQMQPMVKEAIKLLRSTIPATIEIKQDIQTKCRPVKADPTQIHQIVMNLATNAYHAMGERGGELKIILKEVEFTDKELVSPDITSGIYACLTVQDTGTGMDKALTDKIFEPFFTTKERGKGTGMGLSVVHGIVHNLGGAIKVYSEPGRGSVFNIYLPVVQTISKQESTDIEEPLQMGTGHILLVDDETSIVEMEQAMLNRLGYKVTARSGSMDALEAFKAAPDKFDLVITDMQMPNMSGDKLAVELTKIRPDIPILLCTGFSETMSKKKAALLGIKGFLLKPILIKTLSQKIGEVLNNIKADKR